MFVVSIAIIYGLFKLLIITGSFLWGRSKIMRDSLAFIGKLVKSTRKKMATKMSSFRKKIEEEADRELDEVLIKKNNKGKVTGKKWVRSGVTTNSTVMIMFLFGMILNALGCSQMNTLSISQSDCETSSNGNNVCEVSQTMLLGKLHVLC